MVNTVQRVVVLALLLAIAPANAKTALEFLREAKKPQFRDGHTLPNLTRWGWTMPFDVRVELAENWGYALEFGEANPSAVAQLNDPNSIPSKICALASSNPGRYRIFLSIYRPFFDRKFLEGLPEETWCYDSEGRRVWSPEAPDEVFERAAEISVLLLKKISALAPISIILNGGEYALSTYGWAGKAWASDQRVLKAKGDMSWFDYISKRKASQELIIKNAIKREISGALYIYYHTEAAHRNRYPQWWHWSYDYKQIRKVSDLPSSSIYYLHFNSGFTGDNDMLTQALNCVAQQIECSDLLSYNWVNAGWERKELGEKAFADLALYMGYLKCYYTAGMIGGVAGYFAYPKGGFDGDVGDKPPHWLQQMMVLSYVHALFSHLEDFLRDGVLLPGPNRHRWSKDLPAYEFPTGEPNLRVLVRKHNRRNEWLITAWAADGNRRKVQIIVPEIGRVELIARPCGSVYRATLKDKRVYLTQVDESVVYPVGNH
ncbi:MAG: hypothetical protein RMK18_11355 [Armatimonadota bacterium]|nr:hypothetical protein [Armatimonadota bacterium]MCX7778276.1 hypothetical protein [Armatimonadota bacterium]MDW8026445.1 hypothetical protein [Armatimonadota bacterium]